MHRKRLSPMRSASRFSNGLGAQPLRRGIATIWVILSLPVALILLITVVEIGNLWTARTELQTNLEAAALAGVKTWGDESEDSSMPMDPHPNPGEINITGAARDAAIAAFAVNSVNGQFFTLNRNETDDGDDLVGYDNTNCSGDIILGGFPTAGGNVFNAAAAVGCGRSSMTSTTVTLEFDILIKANDTLNTADAFQITLTSASPGLYVSQLDIDLHNIPDASWIQDTDAVWDFGTFRTFSGAATEATGNGPAIHASSDVLDAEVLTASGDGTGILTLTFADFAWQAGESLVFGVDTDNVEQGGDVTTSTLADAGNDFGETGAATKTGRVAFSFTFGNTGVVTIDNALQESSNQAQLQGAGRNFSGTVSVVVIVPDEDFAVLCQKSVQVNSITNSLFGIPMTPFTISGRAIATARCAGANSEVVNNPLVVHVSGVSCP